jgi:hypothetical protein
MFKVSPASLKTFIDSPNHVLEDRVWYSMVHIPDIILVSVRNCFKYFCMFFCTVVIRYFLTQYCAGGKIEKNEMGGTLVRMGGGERCAQGVGGEARGKEAIGETQT